MPKVESTGRSAAARIRALPRLTLPALQWKLLAGGLIAAVITVLAFLVRLFPVHMSHWWDEAVYLQHAEVIFSGRTNWDELTLRPPMLSVLIAGAFLIRHDVVSASVLVALLSALGVLFMYLLGKVLYDSTVGLLAAAFIAVTPYFITASHWIMIDVPSTTFLTIAFYLLVVATKRDSEVLYTLSGAMFGAAILTRFTSLIVILVVPLYFLIIKVRWSRLLYVIAGSSALLIPYFAWAQMRYGFFLSPFITAHRAVSDSVGDASYYFSHFTEIYPLFVVIGLIIYFVAVLVRVRPFTAREEDVLVLGIRLKVDVKAVENLRSTEAVLILWIVLFFAYMSTTPHKEPRYILPLAPPLLLLASLGYAHLLRQKNWLRVGAAALLLVLTAPALQAALKNLRPPYVISEVTETVSASRFLVSLRQRGAVVYANYDYPVLAYYTGLPTVVVPSDQSFYSEYPKLMKRPGFFVFYRGLQKEPTQTWLNTQPSFRKIRESREIIIYRFEPAPLKADSGARHIASNPRT